LAFCRLVDFSFCCLFVLWSFRGIKTTFIVLTSCLFEAKRRRKDNKTTKRQPKRRQIRSLISGLCLSSFRPHFVDFSFCCHIALSSFRGEKTIIIVLSSCRLFATT
jgi:hypothetical protein